MSERLTDEQLRHWATVPFTDATTGAIAHRDRISMATELLALRADRDELVAVLKRAKQVLHPSVGPHSGCITAIDAALAKAERS
jgi:hypothetical protein